MKSQTITPAEARLPPGELALWIQLRDLGGWERQYKFAPPRRWRFDFGNPTIKLAIEIDGGSGTQAHGQVWGREKDYRKRNEAVARGWTILLGTTEQAENGELIEFVRRCLKR